MSKIYKARQVTVDRERTVNIEVMREIPEPEPVPDQNNDFPEEKSESPEETAKNIIKKAGAEAEMLLKQAKFDAEALLTESARQAEEEAEAIKTQARDEGYAEGYKKAEEEGQSIINEAETVLENAKAERARMQEALEPEMVGLIIGITGKLLGDTVKLYPQTIINLIKQGVDSATLSGKIHIRVSPEDYNTVTNSREELNAFTDSSVELDIIRDPSLNKTDCVIETPFGNIDCSLDMQYETLRDQLTYILDTRND